MAEQSDINTGKVFLIGTLGVIVTVAVSLVAIVSYFAVDASVEQSRSDEAARRIYGKVEAIADGEPVAQPWLNPDLQRATQQAQLERYAVRVTTEEDGTTKTSYAVPIEQAMESVLTEAADAKAGTDSGEAES